MASTRCGISAKQIERETGVTYKTAWRMFKQIRTLLCEDIQLKGTVEIDETYYGGVQKYGAGRPVRADRSKTTVLGMVERKGRAIARVRPDASGPSLLPVIRECVLPESTVYSDEWRSYQGIGALRKQDGSNAPMYSHRRIKHKQRIYVMGDIHTQTVEGFWSLLKRGIGGVYHSVSDKYLQSYLDEYSFRYNHRADIDPMFLTFLRRIVKAEVESGG
jgi:transposase